MDDEAEIGMQMQNIKQLQKDIPTYFFMDLGKYIASMTSTYRYAVQSANKQNKISIKTLHTRAADTR